MVCCRKPYHHHHLAILFLLLSVTTTFLFSHVSCSQLAQEEEEEVKAAVRSLIGSRPPSCDHQVAMRCKNCGHCEAVQVPIDDTTADQKKHRPFHHHLHSKPMAAAAYSAKGGGNIAENYKPMCWKCKCGNFIFNP